MITFEIRFHGPFHVARGTAERGLDRTVDEVIPLPASSLKGLMKAQAKELLRISGPLVDEIFGAQGIESPWSWSDADLPEPHVGRAARIRIGDSASGRVERGFVMLGQHVWASSGYYTVTPKVCLTEDVANRHVLLLRAAGRSISALGGGRRRGEGWVSITDGAEWTEADSRSLLEFMDAS